MTDQSQTRWARGPVGRVAIRHRYLPDAEITNTFLSEGLAATGLRVLMPPSCGHTGLGWGGGRRGGGLAGWPERGGLHAPDISPPPPEIAPGLSQCHPPPAVQLAAFLAWTPLELGCRLKKYP